MKKILIIILTAGYVCGAPVVSKAQTIDTVLVRNFTIPAEAWGIITALCQNEIQSDSAGAREFRRIRDRIKAANPATKNTNVTVDSIPGRVVLFFYKKTKATPFGIMANRGPGIVSAVGSKQNMAFFISPEDVKWNTEIDRLFGIGKFLVLDN